jgi:carbonic anhydrase
MMKYLKKLKHNIIVYGHYGYGGVKPPMGNQSIGLIDNWMNAQSVYRLLNTKYFQKMKERFNKFVGN